MAGNAWQIRKKDLQVERYVAKPHNKKSSYPINFVFTPHILILHFISSNQSILEIGRHASEVPLGRGQGQWGVVPSGKLGCSSYPPHVRGSKYQAPKANQHNTRGQALMENSGWGLGLVEEGDGNKILRE